MAQNRIRKHFIISGRVQGVGFRYKAYYLAEQYRLGGWVMNLDNGDVEMEIEGTREEIQRVMEALKNDRYIYIDDIRERDIPVQDEHHFSKKY